MIQLVPMTESEYDFWQKRSVLNYAADKKISDDLSEEEAKTLAENSFHRLLPQGLKTKDQFLYCMKDDLGNLMGHLWFGLSGPENRRKAFLYDIIIDEKWRGQGFGKRAMLALEKIAKEKGAKSLGLHVFSHNPTAVGLYSGLGFKTTDLVMVKDL